MRLFCKKKKHPFYRPNKNAIHSYTIICKPHNCKLLVKQNDQNLKGIERAHELMMHWLYMNTEGSEETVHLRSHTRTRLR